jgi:alkylation response protein AidB-like acyl-CoA dehydrogenase
LIRGEWLGAWALTEPNAGSDSRGIETAATETESGWEITGHKTFITQGRTADLLVVMASSGKTAAGKNEISAFLVPKDQVQPIRKIPTYGVRASETSELRFHRAKGELLGPRGRGQEQALAVLDHGRLGVAAVALGIAQAALDAALRYALQRRQFGQRIAEFEAIQWMSADASTALDAAELLSLRAAGLLDQGKNITKEAAMAKLFASEAATRIGNAALQIHGGYGYSRDLPLERYLRDAKICEIGEGTSEIQRLVIARQVFREVEKGHTLGR